MSDEKTEQKEKKVQVQSSTKQSIVKNDKKSWSRAKTIWTIVVCFVAAIIVAIVGLGVGVYQSSAQTGFFVNVAKYLPYPAARVDGTIVSMKEYNDNARALTKYFMSDRQVDLNDSSNGDMRMQVSQSIVGRMVEDITVQKVAEELGVTVSDAEIDEQLASITSNLGSEDEVKKTLDDLYGWTKDQFKNNVLRPQLLKDAVQKKYNSEEQFTKTEKDKANDLLQQIKDGADFATLAKENSDDPQSGANGGDLGTNANGTFVKEFEDAALKLKDGEVSDVVQTQFGFHIIKMISKGDNDLHVAHILIATNFDEYLKEKEGAASVNIFVRGLTWDKTNVAVKVSDYDGDGVLDTRDVDDDNDGFSDTDEDKVKSQPLDKTSTPETVQSSGAADTDTSTTPTE